MLLLVILWAIALVGIVYFNARFWKLFPDQEDKQHHTDKSQNISPVNPVAQDNWHLVRLFLLIGAIGFVVYLVLNAID